VHCVRASADARPSARHGASFEFEGVTYEWRIDLLGKMAVRASRALCVHADAGRAQCFVEGASAADPVAWHNRHRKAVLDGRPMMRPAAMGLSAAAAHAPLRDQIVLSWMIAAETAHTWPYNVA
jgi:hypothetical protein